jgi:Bacterial aa3 type cytochrome c oxidase subunit IV
MRAAYPLSAPDRKARAGREHSFHGDNQSMTTHNDIKSAEKTYAGFLDMFKYGAMAVAVIVAFVIFLIH